jgi:hypothetical protein
MADTPNFNPNDIVNFMNASAKQSAHNAHIRSEFKKLQQHVADFAKLFADDYEVPTPKVRAKRGTGAIAQAKKSAQEEGGGGVKNGRGNTKAAPAQDPKK